jgi:hypothetical protein
MTGGIVRVGVSGWVHQPWRSLFYPKRLRHVQELAFAASHFRAIEVNATFYGPQRPETFDAWAEQVPPGFLFVPKAPREITHTDRLRAPEALVARFFASGVLNLGASLGPVLWQLPPDLRFRAERLEALLGALPRDGDGARDLVTRHLGGPAAARLPPGPVRRPIRHVIEAPHPSFRCPAVIEVLRRHNVVLAVIDTDTDAPAGDVTADFVYCRLRGAAEGYGNGALETWAERCRAWASGGEPSDTSRIAPKARRRKRDVFVVLDTVDKLRAPANAQELIRRLRT